VRILVVHQYYLMKGQSGGSRFNELARFWTQAGHDVTVIAGTVDYVTGSGRDEYRGRWITEEDDGGVRVLRCHVPETYGRSYLGRAWAFFAFTLSAATAALRRLDPDVVVATSPPLTAVVPGYIAAARARAPFVFEIRDLWPESAVTTGVLTSSSPLTKGLYLLERWACRVATRINVLTPAFRTDLIRRGLASDEKIVFVPNGADVDRFVPGPRHNGARKRFGWGDRFVVLYAGAHGRANALGQLVEAAALLRDRPDIVVAFVGDGPERAALEARARSLNLANVVFLGARPKEEMPDLVNACDVGAAVLQNNPTFRTVYPNKVFDYMACERPTLLGIDGVARDLVCEQAKAGVFAEPENAGALAQAILSLASDREACAQMGRNGRAWVLEHATRDALARRYSDVLTSICRRPTTATTPGRPGVAWHGETLDDLSADRRTRLESRHAG
jgi:glycosyltransferase involved in cell wall biosynthesis